MAKTEKTQHETLDIDSFTYLRIHSYSLRGKDNKPKLTGIPDIPIVKMPKTLDDFILLEHVILYNFTISSLVFSRVSVGENMK
eukprot:913570-Amorphochlora_amoeboformis.AAC.1